MDMSFIYDYIQARESEVFTIELDLKNFLLSLTDTDFFAKPEIADPF